MGGMRKLWMEIKNDKELSKELFGIPVIIKECRKHGYDWYDPVEEYGATALTLEKLKQTFKEFYKCSMCGEYHIEQVVLVTREGIKVLFFLDFVFNS